MHPFWIQKIEESRRTSVMQFWTVLFLIVVVPLLLVAKHDAFAIIAIGCFVGAGLRLYWIERLETAAAKSLERDKLPASASLEEPAVGSTPQWQPNPNMFAGAQGVPTTPEFAGGVATTPEFAAQYANGVPTSQFPHGAPTTQFPNGAPLMAYQNGVPTQIQAGTPAPDGFFTAAIDVGQPIENGVPGQMSVQRQPTEPGPVNHVPQKPLHFHDLAK